MCEFCVQHGEGKKWYLLMKNYSEELFHQKKSGEFIKKYLSNFEEEQTKNLSRLDSLQKAPAPVQRFIKNMIVKKHKKIHYGQVVPIEDIEKIIDLVKFVVRIPCVCRKLALGKEIRYCFGVGTTNDNTSSDLPELSEDFEVLQGGEVKVVFRELDEQGLVHSIWTFKTPYIGGICNCDQDCLAYKICLNYDVPVYFKAEYIGVIDWDSCSGCRDCKKFCQYGAILYSAFNDKCSIHPQRCYGCGICRAVCPNDAIFLKERTQP